MKKLYLTIGLLYFGIASAQTINATDDIFRTENSVTTTIEKPSTSLDTPSTLNTDKVIEETPSKISSSAQATAIDFPTEKITNVTCNGGANGSITFQNSLLTAFVSDNSGGGISFDVTLSKSLTITGFDLNLLKSGDVQFYYRNGTASGNELNSAGWILGGSASITSAGINIASIFSLTTPISLPAGTYGFYLVGYNGVRYKNGSTVGSLITSNSDLSIYEGKGRASITAGDEFNIAPISTRNFSGAINYYVNYTWTWSNGANTASISGLIAGNYTCTITDTNNATATKTFTVTQPAAISVSTSQTNLSCNGDSNGTASVTALGGTPSYTYSWAPAGGTAATATGLSAGAYTCTITDANNCSIIKSFTITQPTLLSATTSQTNVSCNGGSNGTAKVTASGGTPGYTYSWAPAGGTAATATGLTVGTYICTITDANGCTATKSFTITQPTVLSATASQTNVSCNDGSNGTATVVVSGGTPSYTYSWSPSGGTAATATGLSAGAYSCTITDANGCTLTKSFTITQPSALSLTPASQTNIACNGGANGGATVNTATGGTPTYSYNWTPGNPTGDGTTAITGLTAGTWTCTVTDANGCSAVRAFTITQPTALSLTIASQTNVTVNGGSNGVASVNIATGGTPTYAYNWTPGNPIGDGTTAVTGLTAGVWSCTVTDGNGCTASKSFTITEPAITTAVSTQSNTSLLVYPNPTSEILNLSNIDDINSIAITDLTGKTVWMGSAKDFPLNVSQFAKGVYLVNIVLSNGTKSIKIVVQ